MSYNRMCKNSIRQAFRMIGDLADTITLTLKSGTDFDFNTATTSSTTTTTKVVKGLLVAKRRDVARGEPKITSTRKMQLIIPAEFLDDPTLYDTATVNGIVWKMVPPYSNDGMLITIDVAREG